ncbi:Chondroitin polymerase [Chlamydia abortus]|uniref:glycosyltransferase n=1 Tax=Paenibacillus sp. SAFN-117 TaxID=3436860 RepID=UPI000A27C422|nr:Chondroitin polymerase [Chlamydia abortus]
MKVLHKLIQNAAARKLISFITAFIYERLTDTQIETLKKKMSIKHKEFIKKILHSEDYFSVHHVKQLITKLLNLGFTEKALEDLEIMAADYSKPKLQKASAWELSLYYADQRTNEGAAKCLEFLDIAMNGDETPKRLRQATIIKAECLARIGKLTEAQKILFQMIEKDSHPDLLFAAANLEDDIEVRIKWINKVFEHNGLNKVQLSRELPRLSTYDSLSTNNLLGVHKIDKNKPKVTVIMPVYNAGKFIDTAINSVLAQTWNNLEIIIIDDCSEDNTVELIKQHAKNDHRIQLMHTGKNSGAYMARNIGLKAATGEFITCHDADDWSHPEKIEKQVIYLIEHPSVLGTISLQCRLSEDLFFHRRNCQRGYLSPNISSLLFRRIPVLDSVGYWDSVRFGGDGEFIRRIKKIFGEKSIKTLDIGPLSFPRVSANSLTENGAFGYYGYLFGARKEYVEAFTHYHNKGESLYYSFPLGKRPFAVPLPMMPDRNDNDTSKRNHFDVIIASDFRLTGGTTSSNIEEIKAQKNAGLSTGLIQISRYTGDANTPINDKVRQLIDGNHVRMIVFGEKVSCDVLIIRHPPILQEKQRYIPDVVAKKIKVIINQTPKIDYGLDGETVYDIKRCKENLEQYFGNKAIWYPIGPALRKTLEQNHMDELKTIDLSNEDWFNIVNINEWRRNKFPENHPKIRIGRHSRDQYVKWPSDPEMLMTIYPDSEDYEICVLGGAKIPEQTLGKLPRNWNVLEFGDQHPKDFLAGLDIFVYYIHPDCIESFGRVIIEAMAVGVPVILPHSYHELFGEAAIYAEPNEVQKYIQMLMNDRTFYKEQVELAYRYVDQKFGYGKHISRLTK